MMPISLLQAVMFFIHGKGGNTLPALDEPAWENLLKFAKKERLHGFLADYIQQIGALTQLPDHLQVHLIGMGLQCEVNYKLKEQQISTILSLFDRHNIGACLIKGAALHKEIYSQIPFREMHDIDLLIDAADRHIIFDLLQKEGFQKADLSSNLWHDEIYMKYTSWEQGKGRVAFVKDRLCVDLHWQLRYRDQHEMIALDAKRIRENTVMVDDCCVPCALDQIMIMLAHDRDRFSLCHVLDLGLYIQKHQLRQDEILLHLRKTFSPGMLETALKKLQMIYALCQGTLPLDYLNVPRNNASYYGYWKEWVRIPHIKDKILFLLGFLIPNPRKHPNKTLKQRYWHHISKILHRS